MQTNNLTIKDEKIPVSIIESYKRKKSLSFKIIESWLIIRIPVWLSNSLLDKFIHKREMWIYNNWINQKKLIKTKKKYVSWEWFLYRWKKYRLKITKVKDKWCKIEFNYLRFHVYINEKIPEQLRSETIKFYINEWYKQKALEVLIEEAEWLIKAYNFDVNKILVKEYKNKYWQCRGSDIFFNYKIVQFPVNVIRHIILHELCHIKHKDHGKKFWNLLNVLDKDSEKNIKWLKENWNYNLRF